jgi:hypothetical protein
MDRSMHGPRSPLTDIENLSGVTNTPLFLNESLQPPVVTIDTMSVIDDTSPLPEPHVTLQRDPSPFQTTLTLPQSSTSRPPLKRTYSYGPRTTAFHSPLTFRESGISTRSNRGGDDLMEVSTSSSMSGPEGELLPPSEPSPTPSEVERDLARFPPSPPESEATQHIEYEAITPQIDQIRGTIALCQAIRRYRAMNVDLSPIMTRSTNNLMIPITAMAEHQANRPLPITVSKYNAIAHLTYISAFTDLIEPYLACAVSMEDEPPSLLQ